MIKAKRMNKSPHGLKGRESIRRKRVINDRVCSQQIVNMWSIRKRSSSFCTVVSGCGTVLCRANFVTNAVKSIKKPLNNCSSSLLNWKRKFFSRIFSVLNCYLLLKPQKTLFYSCFGKIFTKETRKSCKFSSDNLHVDCDSCLICIAEC